MDAVRTVVILAHPVAAAFLIWIFYRQRRWREESTRLRGDDRKLALSEHESMGEVIAMATIGVVSLAFASNIVRGLIDDDDPSRYLLPGHFHGWAGLIGLTLLLALRRLGRQTKQAREEGRGFARLKEIHGKLSDLVALLVAIHAFLGFLYLLTIL